jgi:hypothetical protein
MLGGLELARDALNARWKAIEVRLNQIAGAPCLDQGLCRAEVVKLLDEQGRIAYVLNLNGPQGSQLRDRSR